MAQPDLRLRRARLIQRVRTVEKQAAAAQASAAFEAHARVMSTSARIEGLAQSYADTTDGQYAHDLSAMLAMGAALRAMSGNARAEAARASEIARARLSDLSAAERRRQAAQDRHGDVLREIAAKAAHGPVPAARNFSSREDG